MIPDVKPVPGLGGYAADEQGRIWKMTGKHRLAFKPHPLNPAVGAHGYLTVRVFVGSRGITKTVHTLIARAFHGERPEGHEACHVNGDKRDNRPMNLRWGTTAENAADRAKHGTLVTPRGKGRGVRQDVDVATVRSLAAQGLSINEIAKRLAVSWRTVRKRLI